MPNVIEPVWMLEMRDCATAITALAAMFAAFTYLRRGRNEWVLKAKLELICNVYVPLANLDNAIQTWAKRTQGHISAGQASQATLGNDLKELDLELAARLKEHMGALNQWLLEAELLFDDSLLGTALRIPVSVHGLRRELSGV